VTRGRPGASTGWFNGEHGRPPAACTGFRARAMTCAGYPLRLRRGGFRWHALGQGRPKFYRRWCRACSYPHGGGARSPGLRAAGRPGFAVRFSVADRPPQPLDRGPDWWKLINRLVPGDGSRGHGPQSCAAPACPGRGRVPPVRRSAEMRYFGAGAHGGGRWRSDGYFLTKARPGAHHVLVTRRPIRLLYRSRTRHGGARSRALELGGAVIFRPLAGEPDHSTSGLENRARDTEPTPKKHQGSA